MNTVICIKWGTRYGPKYVNRLYGMLSRNLTEPFRLICFTDDNAGIDDRVTVHDLPDLGCPVPENVPGKWSKLRLWDRELADIEGPALFLDLDVVITGNMDEFFRFGDPDDVILARNWVRPLERLGQTSVFRFPVGKHHVLVDQFREDPVGISQRYQYEQRYVTRCVPGGVRFWPHGWVRHFRMDCLGPWPLRYLRSPRLPRNTRIVIFPGKPDPSDAIEGRWNEKVTFTSRWSHIKRGFTGPRIGSGSLIKHVSRYVIPAPWIQEHWRE